MGVQATTIIDKSRDGRSYNHYVYFVK